MGLREGGILLTTAVLTASFGWFYITRSCKVRKRSTPAGKAERENAWDAAENRDPKGRRLLLFKSLATFMPALMALFMALSKGTAMVWFITAASFCCMAADYLLDVQFPIGVGAFALGHICYLAAYLQITDITVLSAGLFLLLYGGMLLLHRPHLKALGAFKIPAFGYAALLSAMTAMALTAGVRPGGLPGWTIAVGGVFFYASDNLLVWSMLGGRRKSWHGAVLMTLYYSAVYLIAVSTYF